MRLSADERLRMTPTMRVRVLIPLLAVLVARQPSHAGDDPAPDPKTVLRKAVAAQGELKPDEIRDMAAMAEEAFGGVDILVNNAGIQFVSPIEDFPEDKWDAIIAINMSSNFHAIKAVLPGMKARGWGRVITDFKTGEWGFDTIKPGSAPWRDGRPQAPHLNLWLVARGINIGPNTGMYFADEDQANAGDPVLNLIEWENRRATLLAARTMRDGTPVYRFDIKLQGEDETVFFDI